jgi:hypothetical protein
MVFDYWGLSISRDFIALSDGTGQMIRSEKHLGQIYARGSGTAYRPVLALCENLGLKAKLVYFSEDDGVEGLVDLLRKRPQIVSVSGEMVFSCGKRRVTPGHIIVITGFELEKGFFVNDPAFPEPKKMLAKDFLEVWHGWRRFAIDISA